MKLAICNEIFRGWSIEDTFDYVARAGYDAVEIAPFTLHADVTQIAPAERQRIREAAHSRNLAISAIHWVLVQTEGLYLTHPDAAVRRRTSAYFDALVDFCGDLGGTRIVLGSPKQRDLREGVSREQGHAWVVEVLRDPVRRAEDAGVVICFEPLAPSETNFVNTAEEAIQLIQRMDSSALKIILDVKAMSAETKPIPQIIRESWPHFAYFHANDRNLKGPGFGDVDFAPIAAALREVGYAGYVSVEVFIFDEGPQVIADQSLAYLRRHFP
jgi:sugar phosphate isomerase/epimerase